MERTFDLCEQLAQTDLSEDDTTTLLKEASDLNRKLKAELKRIEEKEKAKKSSRSQSRTKVQTTSTVRSRPTQNVSMRTSVQKPKPSFLPPIASTSKKTGSHKAVLGNSPYASQKSIHRSRIATNLSTDRQSSSAGNSSSSKSERHPTKAITNKTSHSADGLRTPHASAP